MIEEMRGQIENGHTALCVGEVISGEDIMGRRYDKKVKEGLTAEGNPAAEGGWKKNAEDIQNMVDHSAEAFWQVDRDLKFTFTNTACEKLSGGFKNEEFIGRSLLEFLTPDGIESMWRQNGKRLQDEARGIKTDLLFFELQMMRKDGTYFWAGISSSPLRNPKGDVIGYHGIMRDISAFKRHEAEQKRLENQLQKMEKMAAVGRLTGGVAHELNNTMAGILGYSELLLSQEDLAGADFYKNVGSIIHSGERAAAIIADLLAISGRDGASRRPVNLNDLILACMKKNEFLKISDQHPGITFKMDLEPALHHVAGVLPQLDRAILNLLSVSCEQAGPGGTVFVTTRTVYLGRPIDGYDSLREGEYVVLTITDTGHGIADEDVNRAFEPFYIRKVMKKGFSGLELSVAREVVQDHDGFIDVVSRIGSGSIFTLYLPVSHGDIQGHDFRMSRTKPSEAPAAIN
ncbi:MAG: PAS domain S-box protein [Deltaproteobacteria bacterium]